MSNAVYGYVTERIMEQLKKGVIPWLKPWTFAVNYESQREYRGVNRLLLPKAGEYMTFNQAVKRGGKIKQGAKSHMVVYYQSYVKEQVEVVDEDTGAAYTKDRINFERYILRYYKVFHLEDIEGIPSKLAKVDLPADGDIGDGDNPKDIFGNGFRRNWHAEAMIAGYPARPKIITNKGEEASYNPRKDVVAMPPAELFKSAAGYYKTFLHELVHSTGHASRLDRKEGMDMKVTKDYSREELVAEIGAGMLAQECRIFEELVENIAAYVDNWLQALNNDPSMIVWAAGQAEKAVWHILGVTEEIEQEATA